jgi:hypothetical protein
MRSKSITIIVIFLFVVFNIIPSTGFIVEKTNTFVREINTSSHCLEIEIPKGEKIQRISKRDSLLDSNIIYDTEYDDFAPAVAGDSKGRFVACMELTTDGIDYYPNFWYSLDEGITWGNAGYFSESLGSEYPDIDSNKFGFYSTFGGPIDVPGQLWLVIIEDVKNMKSRVMDGSWLGFDDFVHMSISCYTRGEEPWNYGGIAGTGYNGYQGNDSEGCPYIFYLVSDTTGAIDWLNGEDYFHSDIAIDEVTEMSYAVYDNEVKANLLVRKDNFGIREAQGRHPYIGAYSVGDGEINLSNPSIEAHNDTVVIACEEAGNIVCFYSDDGFEIIQKTVVVNSAQFPELKVTFDGKLFACSYIKGGAVYRKISDDGGATWTDEQMIDESQAVTEFGTHDLARGKKGIYSVWEDVRGTDIDIYFAQAVEVQSPELDIIEIKGPMGVTATIKNIGDADATNVEWTLRISGGILELINKIINGSQDKLEINEQLYIKSGIIVGLGKLFISATVKCSVGSSITEERQGNQIFFITLV